MEPSGRLNVLFLLHLPPPVHGSSVVGEFIKNSPRVNGVVNGRYLNLLTSQRVDLAGYADPLKLLRFGFIWFHLLVELIKKRPDVCYFAISVSGSAFYKDLFFVILLRLFGVKRIYHMHNKGVTARKAWIVNRLFYPFFFFGADVIMLSQRLYSDISKFVPESRVFICPNGIPEGQPDRAMVNAVQKPVKILFLSNLIESKGVYVLLEACSRLRAKGVIFECAFVGGEGDIAERNFVEKVAELNVSDCVKYIGRKFGSEKDLCFDDADIFAFPTYYKGECFPLVLLEAMRAGLPIVSTYEGGIPDIIEDGITGFVIPQNDIDLLAARLELLIQDSNLRVMMGKAGYGKFKNEFTLVHFEDRIVDILTSVA